jgi:hypothetical protein
MNGRAVARNCAKGLLVVCALSSALACDKGELDQTEEPAGIQVRVTGHVVEAGATSSALSDQAEIEASVFRTSGDGDRQSAAGPSKLDKDGKFSLAKLSVEPWNETYELVISDAAGVYRERTLALFALSAGTLDYGEIALTRLETEARTQVRGRTVDAATGLPVADALVSFYGSALEPVGNTRTDQDGDFTLEGLPVQGYHLEIAGDDIKNDSAPEGYVKGSFEAPLSAGTDNNLGNLVLAPKREANELTLVFVGPVGTASDGSPTASCLKRQPNPHKSPIVGITHYFPVPASIDINGAFGLQYERWGSEGLTRPDGFGFGTEFWPVFLGLRSGSTGVTVVPVGQGYELVEQDGARFGEETRTNAAGEVVIDARVFDFDDAHVEVMTFPRVSPLDNPPRDLGYYYRVGGQRRFPVGVGLFSANVQCFESSSLDVYQGDSRLGHFELATSTELAQIGELTEWAPVMIETGFSDPFSGAEPGPVDGGVPTLNDTVYLGVLPFGAVDLNRTTHLQAYEQPAGVRSLGDQFRGWDPAPTELLHAKAASQHALFIGRYADTWGAWMLDGSSGPVRTETHLAGKSDRLAKGDVPLAIDVAEFSRGSEFAMVAVENSSGEIDINQWVGGQYSQAFECGKPLTLGYVAGQLLVGSKQGLALPECSSTSEVPTQPAASTRWVRDLVLDSPFDGVPVVAVREIRNEQGLPAMLIGTTGSGLWIGDPGADEPWQRVDGISEKAAVVAATTTSDALYVLTTNALLKLNSTKAEVIANDADADFGTVAGDDPDAAVQLTSLAAFRDRVYVGTSQGVLEYDPQRVSACDADAGLDACGLGPLAPTGGLPEIAINDLVSFAGRFYALTGRGLFELLAPDMSIAGAVADESIRGLQVIPIPDPPPMDLPPPPPPPGMTGDPMGPPPGMTGDPMGPPPGSSTGNPMGPPPGSSTGNPMGPPPGASTGKPPGPPPGSSTGNPMGPPPGSGGAGNLPPPPSTGGAGQ